MINSHFELQDNINLETFELQGVITGYHFLCKYKSCEVSKDPKTIYLFTLESWRTVNNPLSIQSNSTVFDEKIVLKKRH